MVPILRLPTALHMGSCAWGGSQEVAVGLPPTEHISMVILETNPLMRLGSWFRASSWRERHPCACASAEISLFHLSFLLCTIAA